MDNKELSANTLSTTRQAVVKLQKVKLKPETENVEKLVSSMQTMGNCGDLIATNASQGFWSSTLFTVSPGNNKQPPATTH